VLVSKDFHKIDVHNEMDKFRRKRRFFNAGEGKLWPVGSGVAL
jgi:hypothetical protein